MNRRQFVLSARLMDEPRYEKTLYADISAITQMRIGGKHFASRIFETCAFFMRNPI